MGATTQFDRIIAEAHYAHDVAVFFIEESQRAFRNGFIIRPGIDFSCDISTYLGIDLGFDSIQLVAVDRLEMRKVETQSLRRHQRALLAYMAAQHIAQRRVQ